METIKLPLEQMLFKKAWGIYKKKLSTLIVLSFIPNVFTFLWTILFMVLFATGLAFITPAQLLTTNTISYPLFLTLFAIYIISSIFFFTWSSVALLFAIKENVSVISAYKRAVPFILPFLWVNILTGLAVFSGFLLLIIPAFFFMLWFSLAQYICIFEKERGLNALVKSALYVKGIAWRVFWYFFFAGLLFAILGFLFSALTQAVPFFDTIALIFVLPLFEIYFLLVYEAVKSHKGTITVSPTDPRKMWYLLLIFFGLIISALFLFFILPEIGYETKETFTNVITTW